MRCLSWDLFPDAEKPQQNQNGKSSSSFSPSLAQTPRDGPVPSHSTLLLGWGNGAPPAWVCQPRAIVIPRSARKHASHRMATRPIIFTRSTRECVCRFVHGFYLPSLPAMYSLNKLLLVFPFQDYLRGLALPRPS